MRKDDYLWNKKKCKHADKGNHDFIKTGNYVEEILILPKFM